MGSKIKSVIQPGYLGPVLKIVTYNQIRNKKKNTFKNDL